MKKLIAFLLGLTLTLTVLFLSFDNPFIGNDPTVGPTSIPTQTPTTAPVTIPSTGIITAPSSDPVTYDLPMTAIALTDQTETSRDENGQTFFTYTYPNIRLYLLDADISDTVTLDLLNRIDATRISAESVRADAAAISNQNSFYRVQYSPARIDNSVLSLACITTNFSGGAHPSTSCTGVTYDLITGTAMTLEDILSEECTADVLCRLVVDALATINENELLYSDFSVSVEDRFSDNYLTDEGWYFSQAGLCFTFEPYEVGPYASGIITAEIPYSRLLGYLKDDWFPPERISTPGELTIESLSDNGLDPYASLAELNLDPDAAPLVLHTDTLLYDIVIETVGINPVILFSADHMSADYAIVVRSAVPLQIRYTANDTVYTVPCSIT